SSLTATNGAPHTVSASFAHSGIFLDSSGALSGGQTVNPKDLTIQPANDTKTYGATSPDAPFSGMVTGLVTRDAVNVTYGSATGLLATSAVPGPDDITVDAVSFSSGSASNYNIIKKKGALTVSANDLTITANSTSKNYGDTVTFAGTEFTTSGLKNSDTVTSVTLTSAGAAATATVGGSPYSIVPSAAVGTGLANYNLKYVNGTLTVNQRPATVKADDKSKNYGDSNPALTATVTGTVNGDTLNYTLATAATQFSSVSSYSITVTLGSNPNYSITQSNGTLTVNQRPATVKADDKTKFYGDANPALTAMVTGTVNGDTLNYTLATAATQFSSVSSYSITVTLGSNPNYSIT